MGKVIFFFLLVFSFTLSAQNASDPNIIGCYTDQFLNNELSKNSNFRKVFEIEKSRYFKEDLKSKSSNTIITIPVVFHILHTGEAIGQGKNLSDSKIAEQMQVLNDVYANKNNKGVDTKIRFCIAQKDIYGNSETGVFRYRVPDETYYKSEEADQKIKLYYNSRFPDDKYLNIWIANVKKSPDSSDIIFGYSTLPFSTPYNSKDGLVINYPYIGLKPSDPKFGMGKTLPHEVGHWLGLWHTFILKECLENDCNVDGDEVCDTEPREYEAWSELEYPDCNDDENCNGNGRTNAVQNYMDYNYDPCLKFFTQGQKDRMRRMIGLYRSHFLNSTEVVTRCQIGTDPTNPNDGCYPAGDIDYGLHIQDGTLIRDVAIDDDLFGYSSSPNLLKLYQVQGCNVLKYGVISGKLQVANYLNVDSDFIEWSNTIEIKNGVVIGSGTNNGEGFVVTFKNVNSEWVIDQFIDLGDGYEYQSVIVQDNEIVVLGRLRLALLRLEIDKYQVKQNFNILAGLNSGLFGRYPVTHSYNGRYLVSITRPPQPGFNSKIFVFSKNSSNLFNKDPIAVLDEQYSNVYINNENDLFISTNERYYDDGIRIHHYEINGNLIKRKNIKQLNRLKQGSRHEEQVIHISETNGILALARNGVGITFHDSRRDLNEISVPLITSFPANVLNPYQADDFIEYNERVSSDYARIISAEGDILLATSSSCRRLYVYQLNNLMEGAANNAPSPYASYNFCDMPTGSFTFGNEVTIGGNCNVTFTANSNKTIYNQKRIVLKSGTILARDSNTKLRSLQYDGFDPGEPSCTLSLYTNKNAFFDDYQYWNEEFAKDDVSDLDNDINESMKFSVVPNPIKNTFRISAPSTDSFSFKVYNILGLEIMDMLNANRAETFSMEDKPNGIYLIKIIDSNGNKSNIRFVKE